MKIAVCLSGQPRTYKYALESLKRYFSGDYEVDYFCHAWNYDTNKVKNTETGKVDFLTETIDVGEFEKNIIERLQPKKLVVDSSAKLGQHQFPWNSLLYSLLMANHYKRQFENINGFKYDYVIKARYDLVFDPTTRFKLDDRISGPLHHKMDIYTAHNDRMEPEYYRFNPSDVIYYGSSFAMDIAADLFWYVKYNTMQSDDCRLCGPGTLMSDYARMTGLAFFRSDILREVIYRHSAIGLNPETDFGLVLDKHTEIYR